MSDKSLRAKIIRLAHSNPNLRPHLLPLIKQDTKKEAALPIDKKALKVGLCVLEKLNRELHPSINRIGLSQDDRYAFRIDYSSSVSFYDLHDASEGNKLGLTETVNDVFYRVSMGCGAAGLDTRFDHVSKRVLGHPDAYIKIIRR